jgi:hypothetical protein
MAGKIKRSQAKELHRRLGPSLNYLYRLRERLQKVNYLPGDRLYVLADKAYQAVHALCVEVHYLSCDGTGKTARE